MKVAIAYLLVGLTAALFVLWLALQVGDAVDTFIDMF